MPTTASTPAVVGGLRRQLLRSVCITALFMAPALITRIGGLHPSPVLALVIYGAAVVAASFVLAWAAEAAQIDVSGGLAIAVLALIAVLPEYAVDLYYAYVSGHVPEYTQYAAANMTGSNRLLMGLGWPVVVLLALAVARKTSGHPVNLLSLEPSNRIELGFLTVAGVVAFVIPVSGQIHLALGIALLAWFGFYLFTISRGEAEEPDLVGTAAAIGMLPKHLRRSTVVTMFVLAASVILLCAEPFSNSLVSAGTQLGIDQFLLVQWLAPLASEAPEFIIAAIFAARGKGTAAIATLISSKVNQWTLLIGSLPLAHLAGGGGFSLVLDARQVEETLLTATQTMMGVALILALRFHRATAWALLALFVVQFPITSTHGRLILCGVYGVLAIVGLIVNRHHIIATIRSPFHRSATLQLTVP
ncbi:sodium:proton exchanger [Mycobacteroides abscessus]|uniref:sodium:proton exchanger n=1 Tax=Mycobacteroides abscessus TaxID=36809 RepID=UPI0005DF6294|nr:sodium:proton exchanger [Mycobacteroides abscessus]CPS34604.1 Sodium/calcium exchanger family protein [Mycobacteroides abscessus]CPS34944.1 Sodium/calcium exchanger family protein [Mycobacteroides abscessus]CPS35929.1 Sodium/calcium exchanger family protein [Mycobacteroides abscessus]CPT21873.1 Sodium/calcium exchanger family protein [Mycobacteroides abscessus]CPT45707.1 Sodium/calcium exchanger family protein [Mycobacteroides abscessus]